MLQTVMQHNFFPSLFMCVGGILALHSVAVTKSRGCVGCPVVVAEGPSQTGKSTSLSVALSLLGMLQCN